MNTNSAIQLLRHFSEEDIQNWQAYLGSAYFHIPIKLQRLGASLAACWPDFPPDKTSAEYLYDIIYRGKGSFHQQQVYDAFSQLLKQTHRFLVHESISGNSSLKSPLLLKQLSEIQAEEQIKRKLKSLKSAQSPLLHDQEDALSKMLVSHEATLWVAKQQTREKDQSLEEVMRHTDQYYLLSRLKYTCEWLNRSNILPVVDHQESPLSSFPSLDVWPTHYFEEPLISLYRHVFNMLRNKDPAAFQELIKMLHQYGALLGTEEAIGLYAYAQNFCIGMINRGETRYLENLFNLYDSTLSIGLLLDGGELDHRQYKNIVTVGLRLKKYDWVESFLEENKSFLSPKYRENAYVINLASLRYEQRRYHEALSLLQQLEFMDVYYQLTARVMMLKIYFEQQEEEGLEHLLETFRMFLQRNKEISSYQRQIHLNLVRFTKKLHQAQTASYRLSAPKLITRLQQLDKQVFENGNITNVSWLHEQISGLIKRYDKAS